MIIRIQLLLLVVFLDTFVDIEPNSTRKTHRKRKKNGLSCGNQGREEGSENQPTLLSLYQCESSLTPPASSRSLCFSFVSESQPNHNPLHSDLREERAHVIEQHDEDRKTCHTDLSDSAHGKLVYDPTFLLLLLLLSISLSSGDNHKTQLNFPCRQKKIVSPLITRHIERQCKMCRRLDEKTGCRCFWIRSSVRVQCRMISPQRKILIEPLSPSFRHLAISWKDWLNCCSSDVSNTLKKFFHFIKQQRSEEQKGTRRKDTTPGENDRVRRSYGARKKKRWRFEGDRTSL